LSYQIVPNLIFLFAVLGILLIILRRLPEAASQEQNQVVEPSADKKLLAKGVPAQAFSKIRGFCEFWIKKIWNFALEAKDLRPHEASGYKMKKIFGGKLPTLPGFKKSPTQPITTHEVRDEKYYLEMIKLQPRNLANYDALGKFYTEQENFPDARDIYLYLVNHESYNPEYHSRLAHCYYKTKAFDKAAAEYQKSLSLDSTQPNRYYNLGLSLQAAGDSKEAAKAISKALELEPTNPKYIEGLKKIQKR
jgi:tetratricopeptide (TPR) repeat protein